ncbi:hypothetical protein M9434_002400 [Picochlorum sp. BPE23]|nr:hypothetical protein M9435_006664 [Picochlorum sp. BPE23]KAI8114274.1 hypothetical protein M9434_002400 [Picochlorum sp. BPE23]
MSTSDRRQNTANDVVQWPWPSATHQDWNPGSCSPSAIKAIKSEIIGEESPNLCFCNKIASIRCSEFESA